MFTKWSFKENVQQNSLLKQKVKRIKPVIPANDPLPETT